MKSELRKVRLDLIDIPESRLRSVKSWRVETLAGDMQKLGLFQPVLLVAEEDGRFTLDDGAHRTGAARQLGWIEIDANVTPAAALTPQHRRMREIMANIDREDLTKLERAENLAELQRAYEKLYPATRHGGDRKSKARKDQKEIFSFRSEAADKTGLSVRAINMAVAIVTSLGTDIKARLRDTWLADHQAGLKLLSEQTPDMQGRVCDLLFATPPEAANVAEAIVLADGRRLPTIAEKAYASALSSYSRLSAKQRTAFFDLHREAIRAYAKEQGWL